MQARQSQQHLEDMLADSISLLNQNEMEVVKRLKVFEEERCYNTYTRDEHSYLEYLMNGKLHDQQVTDVLRQIHQAMIEKQETIGQQISDNNVNIEGRRPINKQHFEAMLKEKKIKHIQRDKDALEKELYKINRSIEQVQLNNQEQTKEKSNEQKNTASRVDRDKSADKQQERGVHQEFKSFIQKNHKDKLQRKQKIEQTLNKMAEREQLKKQQEKRHEEEMSELKRQQAISRKKHREDLREKQKMVRSQHELQFTGKVKSNSVNQHNIISSMHQQDEQFRRKLQTRREKLNLIPIDSVKLEQHSRRYEQFKQKQQEKRQEKLKLQIQKSNGSVKHSSSYDRRYHDLRKEGSLSVDEIRQPLRLKLRRIKDYQSLVKDKFRPKIDPLKRKQLQYQIEELELGGRYIRRRKLENGSVLFEQIHKRDPNIIGIQYLEYAKRRVEKPRSLRRPTDYRSSGQAIPRTDYLAELRLKNRRKINFVQKLDQLDSYQQKVQMVQQKTQMLIQQAKRKQSILKHGKFLTPEDILQYKEELDDQYLSIINMKLKLLQ